MTQGLAATCTIPVLADKDVSLQGCQAGSSLDAYIHYKKRRVSEACGAVLSCTGDPLDFASRVQRGNNQGYGKLRGLAQHCWKLEARQAYPTHQGSAPDAGLMPQGKAWPPY